MKRRKERTINAARLRVVMNRYGNTGVLVVAFYLGCHSLWTKRRPLLSSIALVLLAGIFLWRHSTPATKMPKPATYLPAPSEAWMMPVDTPEKETAVPKPKVRKHYHPRAWLLPKAKRIASVDRHNLDYCWLTESRVLMITTTHEEDDPQAWKGYAEILDTRTGTRRHLNGLTRLLNRIHSTPFEWSLSPDGRWLNWIGCFSGDGWPNPMVARLDGSAGQEFGQDKFSVTYWLDNHRWIEMTTRDEPLNLIVHDVDTHRAEQLPLAGEKAQSLLKQHVKVFGPEYSLQSIWSSDEDDELHCQIYKYMVSKKAHPAQTYQANFPAGTEEDSVVYAMVTKRGSRVAYELAYPDEDVGIAPTTKSYCYADLWVSHLNCSHLHHLGAIRVEASKYGRTFDRLQIQWLPDGRHVSFVYHHTLYTVPIYRHKRIN